MSKLKDYIYFLSIAFAVLFWFFTIYGLPPRVSKLESEVSSLQRELVKNDTKTDIILDTVKTIEGFILHEHGGK